MASAASEGIDFSKVYLLGVTGCIILHERMAPEPLLDYLITTDEQ
jgi:hypothetical protein